MGEVKYEILKTKKPFLKKEINSILKIFIDVFILLTLFLDVFSIKSTISGIDLEVSYSFSQCLKLFFNGSIENSLTELLLFLYFFIIIMCAIDIIYTVILILSGYNKKLYESVYKNRVYQAIGNQVLNILFFIIYIILSVYNDLSIPIFTMLCFIFLFVLKGVSDYNSYLCYEDYLKTKSKNNEKKIEKTVSETEENKNINEGNVIKITEEYVYVSDENKKVVKLKKDTFDWEVKVGDKVNLYYVDGEIIVIHAKNL